MTTTASQFSRKGRPPKVTVSNGKITTRVRGTVVQFTQTASGGLKRTDRNELAQDDVAYAKAVVKRFVTAA